MYRARIKAPFGWLILAADTGALSSISMRADKPTEIPCIADLRGSVPVLQQATDQLDEYFAGTRKTFDLPLRQQGTTFQQAVWQALQTIPAGATWSYGRLAAFIGRPRAVRAVGGANARNQIPIVVPCHRVVNADGRLGGYSAGLPVKQWLLDHESA